MREKERPPPESPKVRRFTAPNEYPDDLKQEGLRPYLQYVGGDPKEIIVIGGKRYRKQPLFPAHALTDGIEREEGHATEAEYYSHAGPGWDNRYHHARQLLSRDSTRPWDMRKFDIFDPRILSDLVLYELIPEDG